MSLFAFSQRSRGQNALAHVSDGMNLPLSMTIHAVGKAGYGWSVVGLERLRVREDFLWIGWFIISILHTNKQTTSH